MEEFAFCKVSNRIRVDVAAPCGRRFEGVAWIDDAYSECPKLLLPKPIGFKSVFSILSRWATYLADHPTQEAA